MIHDAVHWDRRYGEPDRTPFTDPDPAVVALLDGMPHGRGRALDLGCGEGRHTVWLASHGWSVTAVDFSHTGIRTARRCADAAGVGDLITWVVADATTWEPDTAFDLVLISLFRLEDEALARARSWVSPGGHVALVAHGDGPDGPRDPRFWSTVDALRSRVADFEVLQCIEMGADTGDPSVDRQGQRRSRVGLLAQRRSE